MDPEVSNSNPDLKRLALALPDIPRWVETRALLLSGECELFGLDEKNGLAFVVTSDEWELASVVGLPTAKAIAEAANRMQDNGLVLATADNSTHVSRVLHGWKSEPAPIHFLNSSVRLPALAGAPVRLIAQAELETATLLPPDLKQELVEASLHSPLAAAVVDGQPVSFCYSAAETESLWDISIDTLALFRNRGYAGLCVSFMVKYMATRGKRPVWGAEGSNLASIRLALKLGFEPVDQLTVFRNPDRG